MPFIRGYLDDSGGSGERTQPMYGVVLGLPEEYRAQMAAIRQRYCPSAARRIFPHITLKGPFVVDSPKELVPVLEDIALRYLPAPVHAGGLGSFVGDHNNVLYVPVERSERLVRLHEAVVSSLSDARDVYPWTPTHQFENWIPHITLADGIDIDELRWLEVELADRDLCCDWEAKELLLVRSETSEDGSLLWTTTRSFRTRS